MIHRCDSSALFLSSRFSAASFFSPFIYIYIFFRLLHINVHIHTRAFIYIFKFISINVRWTTKINDTDEWFISGLTHSQSWFLLYYDMRLIVVFLILISIHNQFFSFASQSVHIANNPSGESIDVQDGHPNHRLWQKMINTGRASPSADW